MSAGNTIFAPTARLSAAGIAIAVWGVGGVFLLVGRAVVRLAPMALEPFTNGSAEVWHWFLVVGWTLLMLWSEGYRGFQKAFAPRVVARAFWAGANPTVWRVILAPLFSMALFHATRKRIMIQWSLVTAIVAAVMLVGLLPQPYRGIVDFGVVAGLLWGLVAMGFFLVRALVGRPIQIDPALPS